MNFVKMIRQELNCYLKRIDVMKILFVKTTFLLEDFESLKFSSMIGEDTNWFFPIGYSKSSMRKVV